MFVGGKKIETKYRGIQRPSLVPKKGSEKAPPPLPYKGGRLGGARTAYVNYFDTLVNFAELFAFFFILCYRGCLSGGGRERYMRDEVM